MDAVGADQNVATHSMHMRATPIEEVRGHPAFILSERAKPAAGMDSLGA